LSRAFFTKFVNSRVNHDRAARSAKRFQEFRCGHRIAIPENVVSTNKQEQERRTVSKLERLFFAIGFALLAVWGAEMLDGLVYSRVALAQFDANQATKARGSNPPPQSDGTSASEAGFALWSVQRIQAYKDSLFEKVDAPLAVLRIPKIQLEVPVFNGTDDPTLNRGVGRIAGTAQVGAGGNLGLAGHRDGFFRGLKDVAQGDMIELAHRGQTDVYVIDEIQIVSPEDVSVLKPTEAPSLTLVTCFPFYFVGSAPQRYVVRASLRNSSQSGESASKDPISTGNKIKPQGE
jgi:sortase A